MPYQCSPSWLFGTNPTTVDNAGWGNPPSPILEKATRAGLTLPKLRRLCGDLKVVYTFFAGGLGPDPSLFFTLLTRLERSLVQNISESYSAPSQKILEQAPVLSPLPSIHSSANQLRREIICFQTSCNLYRPITLSISKVILFHAIPIPFISTVMYKKLTWKLFCTLLPCLYMVIEAPWRPI